MKKLSDGLLFGVPAPNNRELKQGRRQRLRERHITIAAISKNNSFACPARAFYILIHFFAILVFTRRSEVHDRNTRYNKYLNLPRCRLKTGQRSFAYRGATCWNRLPKDLKEVVSTGTFRKRLVNMLLT